MLTDQELREKYNNYEPSEDALEPYAVLNTDTISKQKMDKRTARVSLRPIILNMKSKIQKLCALHRITPIRRRYILTSNNHLRLRYLVLMPIIFIAVTFGALSIASDRNDIISVHAVLSGVTEIIARSSDDHLQKSATEIALNRQARRNSSFQEKISSGIVQVAAALTAPPFKERRMLMLKSGQTLAGILQKEGISGTQAYYAVKAIEKHFDPRKIRPGQEISLKVKRIKGSETSINLQEMTMKLDAVNHIKVSKIEGDKFKAKAIKKAVALQNNARVARIKTSVYGSAAKAGIPSPVIADVIRVFSWDVDFQRDIRQGDKLEILYETYETDDGSIASYGNILYANLSVDGEDIPIYRYKMKNGDIDYFTEDGWSVKKALMKTPIDGARLSSGFGMRKHPVLGYNKMHKGIDFAAPTGTPIYAAGDGTIDFAGRKGGYGNYIRIRHNSSLKTAYAHMHRFAKKMSSGKRVKQGQIIGYVGTTGRSTGAHLHYEVLKNNKQVNPNRVDLPTGEKLKGQELINLRAKIAKLKKKYKSLESSSKMVQRETSKKTTIR